MYSKMLISWTSQKVKEAYTTRNAFDFKHGMLIEMYTKQKEHIFQKLGRLNFKTFSVILFAFCRCNRILNMLSDFN